jgi:polyisoprenoid-binding protein YceI
MDTTTPNHRESAAVAPRWRLDPTDSRAEFRVPHFWGLLTVKGRFEHLDGRLDADHDGPRRVELTIDATSVSTRNRRRDRHLRSADFFDVDRHPQVCFRSTAIRAGSDGSVHVDGELTAAGRRVTLALEPTVEQTADRLLIDARTTIDQRQLGITWSPLGMTRAPVTVHVHAVLRPER